MGESRYEQLVRWRDDARRETEALQIQLVELQKRAEEAKTRLSLMDKLLALEQDGLAAEQPASVSGDLLDACEVILRSAGEPLHIGRIYSELVQQGVPIPGKGNEANVIARLQRSDGRFIRTGRGMYGLPEFGYEEQKPVKHRRRIKRR